MGDIQRGGGGVQRANMTPGTRTNGGADVYGDSGLFHAPNDYSNIYLEQKILSLSNKM